LSPVIKMLRKWAKCLQILTYNLLKNLEKIPSLVYNIYVKADVLKRSDGGFLKKL